MPTDLSNSVPLALRLTPKRLEDFAGQKHLLAEGALLRRAIEAEKLGSAIFYGPSGCGKTALARLIAGRSKSAFIELNAAETKVQDVRKAVEESRRLLQISQKRSLLLVDEIHHFSKTQQDALLPSVEKGWVTLIGLTNYNPFFYVNHALLSRSLLFEFKSLEEEDILLLLKRALSDEHLSRGKKLVAEEEALKHIAQFSEGDARRALSALEIAAMTTPSDTADAIHITLAIAKESIQRRVLGYDKKADQHYDLASAFIKSMRGSDPDAALYWMSRMLSSGEDPRFIARRILIAASEDVGNADPRALVLAASAMQAVEMTGMPEAKIILSQAVTYVACAPKSNAAYLAGLMAEDAVEKEVAQEVPDALKDANADGETLGHGKQYQYPHDHPGHFVKQTYMPKKQIFYEPSEEGEEKRIKERLKSWRA